MPLRKVMKGVPVEHLAAKGLMGHDYDALTPCQRECTTRTTMTIQLEHEAYLTQHPEIAAMLELFISNETKKMKRPVNVTKDAGEFFLQPYEKLDELIRKRLGVPPDGPYIKCCGPGVECILLDKTSDIQATPHIVFSDRKPFKIYDDDHLENDLKAIVAKHHPPKTWTLSSISEGLSFTESSSFLSVLTSDTTLPTPEPTPIPTPTLSQHFMVIISNTVDKAIYTRFDDQAVYYDAAYVQVSKAVEAAMEIPVIDIKADIVELYHQAYANFEAVLDEKQRLVDAIKWEKRMRKKMKRTIRRQFNFKGYETPPSPSATISSHESYRHAPPRPCSCHPQWHYNRLPKDRFGIYLPSEYQHPVANQTVTPVISIESLAEEAGEGEEDDRSSVTKVSSRTGRTSKTSKVTVKFQ